MVSLTDGMYLSHGLTEMLAVRVLGQIDIGVLLRGHGGELAKAHLAWPLHTDRHVYELSSVDELIPYLVERANFYVKKDLPLARLLRPEVLARAGGGVRESLAAALAGTRLTPAQCCSYLYLRELNRRFTIPSLELFRTRVRGPAAVSRPRIPQGAAGGTDALARQHSHPPGHHARGLPAAAQVRNSNTGAPVDAGPFVEFVLDKINTC